jgi:hypothetical protein
MTIAVGFDETLRELDRVGDQPNLLCGTNDS